MENRLKEIEERQIKIEQKLDTILRLLQTNKSIMRRNGSTYKLY